VTGWELLSDYLEAVEHNRNEQCVQSDHQCDEPLRSRFLQQAAVGVAKMKDGTEFKAVATYPKGSVENPMTLPRERARFSPPHRLQV
jgi:hypothetical protein